ncbi:MAG: hypothetical protein ACPGOY_17130 [Rhodospirillaceae bacterium]
MTPLAAVTATENNFAPLTCGLLASLRAHHPDLPIVVLDLGMDADIRDHMINRFGVRIVVPDWHLDPAIIAHWDLQPWWKALLSRPHLPMYCEAETVFWIDADAWVTGPEALNGFLQALQDPGAQFVGVPQFDRCYADRFGQHALEGMLMMRQIYGQFLSDEDALIQAVADCVNGGAFCGPSSSPVWAAWNQHMTARFERCTADNRGLAPLIEQVSLNEVLCQQPDGAVRLLPSRYNWLVGRAAPMLDPDSGLLLEPQPPHDPIHIIHLVQHGTDAASKSTPLSLPLRGGGRREVSLTYDGFTGLEPFPIK